MSFLGVYKKLSKNLIISDFDIVFSVWFLWSDTRSEKKQCSHKDTESSDDIGYKVRKYNICYPKKNEKDSCFIHNIRVKNYFVFSSSPVRRRIEVRCCVRIILSLLYQLQGFAIFQGNYHILS